MAKKDKDILSPKGRITRSTYLLRILPLLILTLSINSINKTIYIYIDLDTRFAIFFIAILCLVFFIIQTAKRLHDTNRSSWYLIIFLIPILNFILELVLIFEDGTHGSNRYGEDPKGRQPKV